MNRGEQLARLRSEPTTTRAWPSHSRAPRLRALAAHYLERP